MEFCNMKEWLDGVVDHVEKSRSVEWFNSSVNVYMYEPRVMVSRGIDIIADELGLTLNKTNTSDDSEICSFDYRGIRFFQICKEE